MPQRSGSAEVVWGARESSVTCGQVGNKAHEEMGMWLIFLPFSIHTFRWLFQREETQRSDLWKVRVF